MLQLFLLLCSCASAINSVMSHDKSKNTARKGYNTTLRIDLMKRLRVLAAHLDKKQNDLIEDAIIDYLNKHEKKVIG